jgi:site-specific recombinase XerD
VPQAEEIIERQFKAHPESEYVFVFCHNKPYTRYDLKCRLRRLCIKAGTSRIYSPYAMRHTFASMESDSGQIETMALARLMGHSTTRTLNRYVSNTLASHLKAVNLIGDRLKELTD